MSQFTINLIQGAVSFRFDNQAAQNLREEINTLMQNLKEITLKNKTGGKPTPKKPMEYQYTGDVFLEIFCNPNIYSSPFSARLLVTLRDDRIRLTSEAELTRLIEDLEQYLNN